MSGWFYGLVEFEVKEGKEIFYELKLCEVYTNNKKQPFMFVPISWGEFKKDFNLVNSDLKNQIKYIKEGKKKILFKNKVWDASTIIN